MFQKPINNLESYEPGPELISGGETVIGKSRSTEKATGGKADKSGIKTTAQALMEAGLEPETPREFVRKEVLARIRRSRQEGLDEEVILQNLFPNTILNFETLETLTSALIAGNNVLLFGPPGSGKTNLAKDVWDLFPKHIFVVEGCPVHDNPFSVVDPGFAGRVPCCPFCQHRFGDRGRGGTRGGGAPGGRGSPGGPGEFMDFDPSWVDPAKVPVTTMKLQEGYGFARVQGSPEVFPDNLTGTPWNPENCCRPTEAYAWWTI